MRPLSCSPFPPRLKWTRFFDTLWRNFEELADIHRQGPSKPVEEIYRRVEPATLDIADRGSIDVSIDGKMLLANSALGASLPKIPSNASASIHGAQSTKLPLPIPSDIHHIFQRFFGGGRMNWSKISTLALFLWLGALDSLGQEISGPINLGLDPGIAQSEEPRILVPLEEVHDQNFVPSQSKDGKLAVSSPTISDIEGWWGIEGSNACNSGDPEDPWRVALGQMSVTERGVEFGDGQMQYRTYDAGCDIHDVTERGDSFKAVGVCHEEDGSQRIGRITLMPVGGDRLAIISPIGDIVLERCNPEMTAVQTASPKPETVNSTPQTSAAEITLDMPDGRYVVRPKPVDVLVPEPKTDAHRSAIVSVYADYCDPTFTALAASPDEGFRQKYTQQLLTLYSGDCTQFHNQQVLPVTMVDYVAALTDLPDGAAGLDMPAAHSIGFWLFMTNDEEFRRCPVAEKLAEARVSMGQFAEVLLQHARQGDIDQLATGYSQGVEAWHKLKSQLGAFACGAPFMEAVPGHLLLRSSMVTRTRD